MSRRYVIGILVVGLLAFGGWAVAQLPQAPDSAVRPLATPSRLIAPFAVSSAGETAVLLETNSGKTWVLHNCPDGYKYWLPVERFNSHESVQHSLDEEQHRYTYEVLATARKTRIEQEAGQMNKDQLVVLEEHLKKEIRATRDDMRQIEREQANRQE